MADETLDDLANAALDGDQGALEVARSNPDLQSLIDEHRRVKEAIRAAPSPVASEQRRHHLEAALAVFDDMQLASGPETPDRPDITVVSLASRRRRRQRWLNVAAAAAVISVGAIGAVGLNSGDQDADDSATTRDAASATSEVSTDDTSASDSPAASRAAPLDAAGEDFESELNDGTDGAFTPGADDDAATAAESALPQATTAAADSTESPDDPGAIFPEGPLDLRFVECLPAFDVPDRPWVASTTISDTSGTLELLVGDDFNTVYRFVFNPSSCALVVPAEPVPDE